MKRPPVFVTRRNGEILEVVCEKLTFRNEKNELIGIENEISKLFGEVRDVRILTSEEADWAILPQDKLRSA